MQEDAYCVDRGEMRGESDRCKKDRDAGNGISGEQGSYTESGSQGRDIFLDRDQVIDGSV